MITIDDFAKCEFKIGTVIKAEEIEGSDRLLKLQVDLNEESPRQILSGIKQWYSPEDLIGKQFVFITNLEPRTMMGFESNGMLLCSDTEKPILISPIVEVSNGSKLK